MSDPQDPGPDDRIAADWTTIWQSEAAAMAVDREMQEAVQRGALLWSGYAALMQGSTNDASGHPGPPSPPGPPPADAAFDAERAALRATIAALERKLAAG